MELKNNEMISIIIPVYNGSKFIEKCLYSIKNQSYNNYEIIIIDNNSTDNSVFLINEFIKSNQFLNINFLKNSINIGFIGNINRGLSNLNINSKYIYIICVDDWVDSFFLEKSIKIMELNPNCSLLTSSTILINESGDSKIIANEIKPGIYDGQNIAKKWFIYTFIFGKNIFSYPVGVFIRRSGLSALSFDENLGSPSDNDFFIRIIINSSIIFCSFIGAFVLDHDKQENKNYKNSGNLLLNQKKFIDKYNIFLRKNKIYYLIKFITLSSLLIRFIKYHDNPANYNIFIILIFGPFAVLLKIICRVLYNIKFTLQKLNINKKIK